MNNNSNYDIQKVLQKFKNGKLALDDYERVLVGAGYELLALDSIRIKLDANQFLKDYYAPFESLKNEIYKNYCEITDSIKLKREQKIIDQEAYYDLIEICNKNVVNLTTRLMKSSPLIDDSNIEFFYVESSDANIKNIKKLYLSQSLFVTSLLMFGYISTSSDTNEEKEKHFKIYDDNDTGELNFLINQFELSIGGEKFDKKFSPTPYLDRSLAYFKGKVSDTLLKGALIKVEDKNSLEKISILFKNDIAFREALGNLIHLRYSIKTGESWTLKMTERNGDLILFAEEEGAKKIVNLVSIANS